MAITHTYTIINKFIQDDTLVTDVTIQFAGDLTNEVTVSIYHFRPETVEEIEASIENRIVTEKDKILAQQVMQELLNEL
jgi:hypothetical protein